jgi:hypothetical protein
LSAPERDATFAGPSRVWNETSSGPCSRCPDGGGPDSGDIVRAGRRREHDFPYGYPNTANGPFDYDFSTYSFKANGTYNARWGILVSPVYRFQAGPNYARRLSVSAPASCACAFIARSAKP